MNNNQRDTRWKDLQLGFGDLTIGEAGCTVSAIGDILGITPDLVNEKLKAVNGFLDSLIIWAKLIDAFPGIQITRVWTYNNDEVKASVPNVIVEVPAQAIGGTGSHWVNYIGNQQCKDPWTGTIRPTSDFPNPTGYCLINKGTWISPNETQAIVDELRTARDANWNLYQAELKKNTELTKQVTDEQTQLQALREAFDAQTKADANTGTQLLDAQHKVNDYNSLLQALGATDLTSALSALDTIKAPHDEVVKQVQPTLDKLADAAIYVKPPKKVSLWTQVLNILKQLLGI